MDVEEAQKAAEMIPEDNSMEKEKYVFTVEYRGDTGAFTTKILTQDDKNQASATASRLRGGVPYDSVDPHRAYVTDCMGWLSQSLVDTPKWYRLGKVIDDSFVIKLWDLVQEHERIFRGPEEDQEDSSATG